MHDLNAGPVTLTRQKPEPPCNRIDAGGCTSTHLPGLSAPFSAFPTT